MRLKFFVSESLRMYYFISDKLGNWLFRYHKSSVCRRRWFLMNQASGFCSPMFYCVNGYGNKIIVGDGSKLTVDSRK